MNNTKQSPRVTLFREAAILQLKLLADGARDAMLIPVSLLAALLGLVEGGENCDRYFRNVLKLGRRSERWINLFGHQEPLDAAHPASSMDNILGQVEAVVMDQYRKGKSTSETRAAVRQALEEEPGSSDETEEKSP